jgi:hypothetical protein
MPLLRSVRTFPDCKSNLCSRMLKRRAPAHCVTKVMLLRAWTQTSSGQFDQDQRSAIMCVVDHLSSGTLPLNQAVMHGCEDTACQNLDEMGTLWVNIVSDNWARPEADVNRHLLKQPAPAWQAGSAGDDSCALFRVVPAMVTPWCSPAGSKHITAQRPSEHTLGRFWRSCSSSQCHGEHCYS